MDKAGDLLDNLPIFSSIKDSRSGDYSGMFSSWERLAGHKLGQYSRIVEIDKQSLIIEVDHPAIIQLLQIKYSIILENIQRKYPQLNISDIRMFVKNSEYTKRRQTRGNDSFPGDEKPVNNGSDRSKTDLSRIDNENFRELLEDMKKRSQV